MAAWATAVGVVPRVGWRGGWSVHPSRQVKSLEPQQGLGGDVRLGSSRDWGILFYRRESTAENPQTTSKARVNRFENSNSSPLTLISIRLARARGNCLHVTVRRTFHLLCTDIPRLFPFNKRTLEKRSKRGKHALKTCGLFAGRQRRLLNVKRTLLRRPHLIVDNQDWNTTIVRPCARLRILGTTI
jgi:hypothetical protein